MLHSERNLYSDPLLLLFFYLPILIPAKHETFEILILIFKDFLFFSLQRQMLGTDVISK